jgi:hypothetical protein
MGRGGQYIGALLPPRKQAEWPYLGPGARSTLPGIRPPEVAMSRHRLALGPALVLMLVLAACGNLTLGPNLDDAVRDMPAAEIRGKIAGHQGWDQRLSGEELDQLAEFLATYAGSGEAPSGDPGQAVWVSAGCSSCHSLRAGEEQ